MGSIKDVAKKAGVSTSTVSRVINNTGYISRETRRRVENAIIELEYEPNQVARSLRRSQSYLIGVIVPDLSHPFFSELIKYIEIYLARLNYKILICNSLDNPSKEQRYISMLRQNRVDGIIMCSHTLEVDDFKKINLPIVTFDRIISSKIPYVGCDNFLGGQLAARHLIEKGCKRLLHLSGPLDIDLLANRRWDAFRTTCVDADVSCDVFELASDELDFNKLTLIKRNKLAERIYQYDGVFSNDIAAYVLYVFLKSKKIVIPEQFKIIGYDYHYFTRMLQKPKLTTIKQPIDKIGKALCSTLIQIIEGKGNDDINNTVINVELIEGETT